MTMILTFSLKLKTIPGSGPRAYDKLPVDQHSTSVLPSGTAGIGLFASNSANSLVYREFIKKPSHFAPV